MKSTLLTLALALPFLGSYGMAATAIAADSPLAVAQATTALQGEWKLTGWGDLDNPTRPLTDTEITAKFMDERLAGSTGCNSYTTAFTTTGNSLELGPVATTMKACDEPISRQESQFLTALGGGPNLRDYGPRCPAPSL
ncbi:META domain-containing protein [Trichothermofontia sp.]